MKTLGSKLAMVKLEATRNTRLGTGPKVWMIDTTDRGTRPMQKQSITTETTIDISLFFFILLTSIAVNVEAVPVSSYIQ